MPEELHEEQREIAEGSREKEPTETSFEMTRRHIGDLIQKGKNLYQDTVRKLGAMAGEGQADISVSQAKAEMGLKKFLYDEHLNLLETYNAGPSVDFAYKNLDGGSKELLNTFVDSLAGADDPFHIGDAAKAFIVENYPLPKDLEKFFKDYYGGFIKKGRENTAGSSITTEKFDKLSAGVRKKAEKISDKRI